MNKSTSHPIVLNGKALLNKKVLINNDIFEVCGRRFQYVNSRMTEEKVKLYRNETGLHFKATTSKSTVTERFVYYFFSVCKSYFLTFIFSYMLRKQTVISVYITQ